MSPMGQKRTRAAQEGMSAYPQKRQRKRNSANGHVCFTPESGHVRCNSSCLLWAKSGHRTASFDHLVRARLHRRRHADAKRLSGFEIDDQFKLGCLYDRQFSGIFTVENPAGINAGQAVAVKNVSSVAHQTASRGKDTVRIDRGHSVANRQGSEFVEAAKEDRACDDYEPVNSQTFYICEHRIEIT